MSGDDDGPVDDADRFPVVVSSGMTPAETYVLKHDDTFAVLDRMGDIAFEGRTEQGLYHGGTKFLSRLRLRLHGQRPLLLSSAMVEAYLAQKVDLTNADIHDASRDVVVPYGTLHVERWKFCTSNGYLERIKISNFGPTRTQVDVSLEFAANFLDVFEVRGTHRRARGKLLEPLVDGQSVVLRYEGLDNVGRRTVLSFGPPPSQLTAERASFLLDLDSKQTQAIDCQVDCQVGQATRPSPGNGRPFESQWAALKADVRDREARGSEVKTSSLRFNEWIDRARADLGMLVTRTPDGDYPYAGVPWFSTPFGRDGLWTALETLWLRPDMARGVLQFLSAHQAKRVDDNADAEPGKILHEMRWGEMATLGEIPFGCYYGSVDATPLYLVLAHRYYLRTGDADFIRSIWPNLALAAQWLTHFGDVDGDGFIEYERRSKSGLLHQGWKDSHDAVFHEDGQLAQGPIALVEVQAYAHAALLGMGALAEVFAPGPAAREWQDRAAELCERFDQAFYCPDLSTYALALDGKKRPCRVRSSNAGHALFAGIAPPARAAAIGHELFSEEMFSGWGIRTLATRERRYNPMSYHNGSIWPHDNAIIAAGLGAYGMKQEAIRLLEAMFEATRFMNLRRLPELFCGFPREAGQGPTLYPVACSPQAWASAAVFSLLGTVLGIEVDALASRVLLRHTVLPEFLTQVDVHGLQVGGASVDLRFERSDHDVAISVTSKRGDAEVVAIK